MLLSQWGLVLAALALRLIAAIVAPEGSPLRLRRPELAPFSAALATLRGST